MVLPEKKTYGYRERSEEERSKFIKYISQYAPERMVYVDEAGTDDTEDYPYGWCAQGERYYDFKLGHKTERISMVAASCCRQVIAPMTFVGYCNTKLIEMWVEFFLLPELLPGQIVIMDNASFHGSARIRQLIEQAGCQLIFLPAYSPDLNKIEKFWARLKNYLRKIIHQFDCLQDAVDHAFKVLS